MEDGGAPVTEYEIDMTSPDNSTRGVYRGRETECVVASLLPGRPYLFQVSFFPFHSLSSSSFPISPHSLLTIASRQETGFTTYFRYSVRPICLPIYLAPFLYFSSSLFLSCKSIYVLAFNASKSYLSAACVQPSGRWSSPLEVIWGAGPPDKLRDPRAVCKSGTAV